MSSHRWRLLRRVWKQLSQEPSLHGAIHGQLPDFYYEPPLGLHVYDERFQLKAMKLGARYRMLSGHVKRLVGQLTGAGRGTIHAGGAHFARAPAERSQRERKKLEIHRR